MTKKHFIAIAAIIDAARDSFDHETDAVLIIARNLADEFQKENPRFNREIFLDACGFAN